MTKKHEAATRQLLDHVDRASGALDDFRRDGITAGARPVRPSAST
jgi:hypothetical protein